MKPITSMSVLILVTRIYITAALAAAAVIAILLLAWTFAVGLTVIAGVAA